MLKTYKDGVKQFNSTCVYCFVSFTTRSAKSKHLKMNRCPELKKLGVMEPPKKKVKTNAVENQESCIVSSVPVEQK